jgi:hypothetical protein
MLLAGTHGDRREGSRHIGSDDPQALRRIDPRNHTDAITRKTLPSFGPAAKPAASNVVSKTKR